MPEMVNQPGPMFEIQRVLNPFEQVAIKFKEPDLLAQNGYARGFRNPVLMLEFKGPQGVHWIISRVLVDFRMASRAEKNVVFVRIPRIFRQRAFTPWPLDATGD